MKRLHHTWLTGGHKETAPFVAIGRIALRFACSCEITPTGMAGVVDKRYTGDSCSSPSLVTSALEIRAKTTPNTSYAWHETVLRSPAVPGCYMLTRESDALPPPSQLSNVPIRGHRIT